MSLTFSRGNDPLFYAPVFGVFCRSHPRTSFERGDSYLCFGYGCEVEAVESFSQVLGVGDERQEFKWRW